MFNVVCLHLFVSEQYIIYCVRKCTEQVYAVYFTSVLHKCTHCTAQVYSVLKKCTVYCTAQENSVLQRCTVYFTSKRTMYCKSVQYIALVYSVPQKCISQLFGVLYNWYLYVGIYSGLRYFVDFLPLIWFSSSEVG